MRSVSQSAVCTDFNLYGTLQLLCMIYLYTILPYQASFCIVLSFSFRDITEDSYIGEQFSDERNCRLYVCISEGMVFE